MAFVRDICTSEIFKRLALPQYLAEDAKLNPLDKRLIYDIESCSTLIPHPFDHSCYPDRCMDFYIEGKRFRAWELLQRSDGPDRIEIYFPRDITLEGRAPIATLLKEAVGILRGESPCTLPVVYRVQSWLTHTSSAAVRT
jgi:hypothetical protein